jgi:hypothetical protein
MDQVGSFSLSGILAMVPAASPQLVKKVLLSMKQEGAVRLTVRGRGALWEVTREEPQKVEQFMPPQGMSEKGLTAINKEVRLMSTSRRNFLKALGEKDLVDRYLSELCWVPTNTPYAFTEQGVAMLYPF